VKTISCNTNDTASTEESTGFGPALEYFAGAFFSNWTDDALPKVLSFSLGSLSWDSCNILCTMTEQRTSGRITKADCEKFMETQRQVCMFTSGEEAERTSNEFMKLGLRGMSIFAATGDGGSHFSFGPFSRTREIGQILNEISCEYNFPTFPAASPWVTGVGGTSWPVNPKQPVGWSGSGSGFSWRFAMPQYQRKAVQGYLAKASSMSGFPPAGKFNATNRAYPDISALAQGCPMVFMGRTVTAGGTSASAPAVAGIVSLLNDVRLTKGLKPLGFINPRLYQIAEQHPGEAFYDVTVGNSKTSCSTGFPAIEGWDPVTGLGSPLWAGLFKYLTTD